MDRPKQTQTNRWGLLRTGTFALLIVAVAVYGWTIWRKHTHGLPPPPESQTLRPSREEMTAQFEAMIEKAQLNDEQAAQMREIWQAGPPRSREDMIQRRRASEEILTPEQIEVFRSEMMRTMRRRLEEARERLSPEDFDALTRRIQQRRADRGGPPSSPQ